jgi:predicted nucleic acid-binding protein
MRISGGCGTMAEFQPGSRIYVDSNIWIYFIEGNPDFAQAVRTLFQAADAAGARLATNEIAVAECLYKPSTEGNAPLLDIYERLFGSGEIDILLLDGTLAKQAALHGGQLGLKLIDAIHYLSALNHGCNWFITSDARFKSGPDMKVEPVVVGA